MLHDVLMTHQAERDEQRIALSPLLRPENFQRLHSTDKIVHATSVCNIPVNRTCDLSHWACVR